MLVKVVEVKVSPNSLFHRLQSMLVDVGESGNNDDENSSFDEDEGDDFEESNIIDLENDDDVGCHDHDEERILDVSSLTLDQRAYMHLRSIHLIDQTSLPSYQPNVIEIIDTSTKNDLIVNNSVVEDEGQQDNESCRHYSSIEEHVQRLKHKLYDQHCKTNKIASKLQLRADEEMEHLCRKRRKKDEDNHIIWKHSQIVGKMKKKREGEMRVKSKVNENEDWVPW